MKKLKIEKIGRQGDVIIQRINNLPENLKKYNRDSQNRILLALGEVTGHAHAIKDNNVDLYGMTPENLGLEKYLEVKEECILTHEEHAPIIISPGIYRISIQREYSPEEIRNVQD